MLYPVCCFLLHAIGHVDSGTVKQKDIKKQPLLITKKHLSNGKKCIAPSFSVGLLVPFFAELSRVCVVSLFMIFMCVFVWFL